MQKQVIGTVALMCALLIPAISQCQTHCALSDGEMFKYTPEGPNETLFRKDMHLKSLPFTQSDKGLLMYIEDKCLETCHECPNAHSDSLSEEMLEHRPYEPEKIIFVLHVCDHDGKDGYAIPVPQKHGKYILEGRFYGETVVSLRYWNRLEGPVWDMLIDLPTGNISSFHLRDLGQISASVSPTARSAVAKFDRIVLLNGKQILPYYSEEIPCLSLAPDAYKRNLDEMNNWYTDNKYPFQIQRLSDDIWSPDGRYCALFSLSSSSDLQGATEESVLQPEVLILDTESVGPGKDFRQYSIERIPVTLDTKRMGSSIHRVKMKWEGDRIRVSENTFGQLAEMEVPQSIRERIRPE